MAKVAVRYYPVQDMRKAIELLSHTAYETPNDARRIEANLLRQGLKNLAPFMPKYLYEKKGKFVPQTARGHDGTIVTRPEPLPCATLLRDVASWLWLYAADAIHGYRAPMCSHAERIELIAAYMPETIDPLHWPLMQQAPNPNGEVRVSNLSGLL